MNVLRYVDERVVKCRIVYISTEEKIKSYNQSEFVHCFHASIDYLLCMYICIGNEFYEK